ncbi:MAG: hypothetical protein WCH85_05735 [Methanomicrobiales archaeon]
MKALDFLNDNELKWVLLHEEGHLQQGVLEQRKWVETNKRKLVTQLVIGSVLFLLIWEGIFILFRYVSPILFLSWWAIPIFLFFLNRKYFNKAYCLDEDNADNFAAEKMLESYSNLHLIPSEVMKSLFEARLKCSSTRNFICRLHSQLYWGIIGERYRSPEARVTRIKYLFESHLSTEKMKP